MSEKAKSLAIVYDFDGTLARGNIQEGSFIPTIANMDKMEFWALCNRLTKEHDADEILVYMHLMLKTASDHNKPIKKDELKRHGQSAQLFPGLADRSWFRRINKFAEQHHLQPEHYIVSSGIEEMIRGCPIAEEFEQIFGSKFVYDDAGIACWAGNAINYTSKTQYLFRINKGIHNVWANKAVNKWIPLKSRAVPFERMIFIGDGDTDIPSMKMTTYMGGHSIAVYDDDTDDAPRAKSHEKVHKLIAEGRANFVAPTDYREGHLLDILVKGIIGRIAINSDRNEE